MFTFEDCLRLDTRSLQTLLKEVTREDLLLALKTASPALSEKVFANISSRAAEILREDMGSSGPVRLRDVEAAQSRIIATLRELEARGQDRRRGRRRTMSSFDPLLPSLRRRSCGVRAAGAGAGGAPLRVPRRTPSPTSTPRAPRRRGDERAAPGRGRAGARAGGVRARRRRRPRAAPRKSVAQLRAGARRGDRGARALPPRHARALPAELLELALERRPQGGAARARADTPSTGSQMIRDGVTASRSTAITSASASAPLLHAFLLEHCAELRARARRGEGARAARGPRAAGDRVRRREPLRRSRPRRREPDRRHPQRADGAGSDRARLRRRA